MNSLPRSTNEITLAYLQRENRRLQKLVDEQQKIISAVKGFVAKPPSPLGHHIFSALNRILNNK